MSHNQLILFILLLFTIGLFGFLLRRQIILKVLNIMLMIYSLNIFLIIAILIHQTPELFIANIIFISVMAGIIVIYLTFFFSILFFPKILLKLNKFKENL